MRRSWLPALVAVLLPFSVSLNSAPVVLAAPAAAVLPAPHHDSVTFTLENNTSYTIIEVYITANDSDSWGDDLLGDEILDPDEALDLTDDDFFDGECLYDIKVVWEDGSAHIIEDIDLCTITTVRYNG